MQKATNRQNNRKLIKHNTNPVNFVKIYKLLHYSVIETWTPNLQSQSARSALREISQWKTCIYKAQW